VRGRAAHSGVDFSNGASAILELARQIARIASFTNLEHGITVNPGVISGGTRVNVIAAEARAEVDIRVARLVARLKDAAMLEQKFRALKPIDIFVPPALDVGQYKAVKLSGQIHTASRACESSWWSCALRRLESPWRWWRRARQPSLC